MNNYDSTMILNCTTTTGNSADICSVRNNSLTNIYSWFSEGISKTQPASPKFLKLRYVVFLYVIVNHFFGADLSLLKESFWQGFTFDKLRPLNPIWPILSFPSILDHFQMVNFYSFPLFLTYFLHFCYKKSSKNKSVHNFLMYLNY